MSSTRWTQNKPKAPLSAIIWDVTWMATSLNRGKLNLTESAKFHTWLSISNHCGRYLIKPTEDTMMRY